jgi:TRAP-type mannitol/chloroaromatic compound transport system permease small subunit
LKLNTKRTLLSVAGLMLSAGNSLAAATNTTSTDIVGNLGMFSTMASTIMTYSKYIAFLMAVISLLALWVSGMLAKVSHKVSEYIDSKEGLKNWLIEAVLVIAAFIVLFSWVIPTINSYVPSSL